MFGIKYVLKEKSCFLSAFLFFLAFPLSTYPLWGQVENHFFYDISEFDTKKIQDSSLNTKLPAGMDWELDYLGYNRNKEYFEAIAEGYTLFGHQILMKVGLEPARFSPQNQHFQKNSDDSLAFERGRVRWEGGIFFNQDFGNPTLNQVQPFIRFLYQKKYFKFIFGNLEGQTAHRLLEPLQTYERLQSRRLETGFQAKWDNPKRGLFADFWVDWVRMMVRFDNKQERIQGGAVLEQRFFQKELATSKYSLSASFQFTGQHRGGQIDTIPDPISNLFNTASGLQFLYEKKEMRHEILKKAYFSAHFLTFIDYSPQKQLAFTQGQGWYLNAGAKTKWGELMLSNWRGDGFFAPMGDELFSSISQLVTVQNPTEKNRHILIIRILNDFLLYKKTYLVLRTEPYYNFNTGRWNFSTGLYVRFKVGSKP
ncbi:hypothetical protein [Hugenholtzia roseola]|uniref:hypothetical protein n=1 Tax=Hugenholtzia roseola TaxID=1002 RepID=UPI00047D5479|nr:hypothetical protein [Hugenholtzia roseola]